MSFHTNCWIGFEWYFSMDSFYSSELKIHPLSFPLPLLGFFKNIPTQQYWTNIEYQSMHCTYTHTKNMTWHFCAVFNMIYTYFEMGYFFNYPLMLSTLKKEDKGFQRCWISWSSNSNWLKPLLFSGLKKGRTS